MTKDLTEMTAEEIIMSLPLDKQKQLLERYTNEFVKYLKEGNDKEADFYSVCCRTVARCIQKGVKNE